MELVKAWKTWSVLVDGCELTDGWEHFCDAHNLRTNYKIVLGCERRWVFEVLILPENISSVLYPWPAASFFIGWYNFDKLASSGHNLLPSCGFMDEFFLAQAF